MFNTIRHPWPLVYVMWMLYKNTVRKKHGLGARNDFRMILFVFLIIIMVWRFHAARTGCLLFDRSVILTGLHGVLTGGARNELTSCKPAKISLYVFGLHFSYMLALYVHPTFQIYRCDIYGIYGNLVLPEIRIISYL